MKDLGSGFHYSLGFRVPSSSFYVEISNDAATFLNWIRWIPVVRQQVNFELDLSHIDLKYMEVLLLVHNSI